MTEKLPKAELERRKRERETARIASDRERKALMREDDRSVEAALAQRAGRSADPASLESMRRLFNQFDPNCDIAALIRHARLVDRGGRNLVTYFENNWPFLFGTLDNHSLRDARSAVWALEKWCKQQRIPPAIEAVSPCHAKEFMASMAMAGLAQRTLGRVDEFAIEERSGIPALNQA